MAGSHWAGPVIQFGAAPYGSNIDMNPDRAPSQFDLGMMLMDPRIPYTYQPGNPVTSKVAGWVDGSYIVLDAAPATLNAANIAASQSPGAGAITLTAGAGVTGSTSIVRADTGAVVTGLLAIDGAAGFTGFGSNAQFNAWDPATMLSRAVTITSGGVDTGITFTVNGYDVYGYPLTATVTGASGAAATTLKTFKYIASVTHTGSVASTVTVGTADIFGLPLRVTDFFYLDLFWAGAFITATTGFTAGVVTSPSTALLGDVRGKYAVQSAADGTKRLQICISLSPAALATMNTTTNGYPIGLFGVAQV
jgi:hypothetical protein